jgi:hypothetical protein
VYDWQAIVNQHGPLVRQTAYRLVGNDADAADPSTIAQQRELAAQLRRGIARLPAPEGKAFRLRHLSGLSYRQITWEPDMNTNAAAVLLHRVKCKMRNTLPATQVSTEGVSNERWERRSG